MSDLNHHPVTPAIIVAMSENRVIGRDGGMPWHLPGDLKHFKTVTLAKPGVMGRRTFQSIGRPLPDRTNIVITRDSTFSAQGITVVHSLDEAMATARNQACVDGVDEVMVIGGGQIYADALARTERIYLTEIHATIDGDTFFPDLPPGDWREVSRRDDVLSEMSDPACSFVILERIKQQG